MNKSAAVPGLNRDDVYRLPLLVPPLPEQRRIAAILDKADALRTKRRQVLAHLDALPQAVFRQHFGSKPSTIPLGELAHFYSGGTPSKADPTNWVGSLPWFSAKDVKPWELLVAQDSIDDSLTERTSLRKLPKDTIVIVVRGMILARSIPVAILRTEAAINQDLKALVVRRAINTEFLAHAIKAQERWLLARVSNAAHGTTKLDSRVLEEIPIPYVSVGDQEAFARVLALLRPLRASCAHALHSDDQVFASLQSRAFNGQL